jgi:hypothetical protein
MGYTIIFYVLIFDFQDWQFVQLGEQQNFGIKTAGLEDKATACQMLVCYARSESWEYMVGYHREYWYQDSWTGGQGRIP